MSEKMTLTRTASLAVPGGEPGKPTSHAGGAKMECAEPHPVRADKMSGHVSAQWEEASEHNNKGEPNEVATNANRNTKAPVLVSIAGVAPLPPNRRVIRKETINGILHALWDDGEGGRFYTTLEDEFGELYVARVP